MRNGGVLPVGRKIALGPIELVAVENPGNSRPMSHLFPPRCFATATSLIHFQQELVFVNRPAFVDKNPLHDAISG